VSILNSKYYYAIDLFCIAIIPGLASSYMLLLMPLSFLGHLGA